MLQVTRCTIEVGDFCVSHLYECRDVSLVVEDGHCQCGRRVVSESPVDSGSFPSLLTKWNFGMSNVQTVSLTFVFIKFRLLESNFKVSSRDVCQSRLFLEVVESSWRNWVVCLFIRHWLIGTEFLTRSLNVKGVKYYKSLTYKLLRKDIKVDLYVNENVRNVILYFNGSCLSVVKEVHNVSGWSSISFYETGVETGWKVC